MAPLDALMRESAFLLGFSMAEQISELHALDITMACSRCQDAAKLLGLFKDFMAMNQMPD